MARTVKCSLTMTGGHAGTTNTKCSQCFRLLSSAHLAVSYLSSLVIKYGVKLLVQRTSWHAKRWCLIGQRPICAHQSCTSRALRSVRSKNKPTEDDCSNTFRPRLSSQLGWVIMYRSPKRGSDLSLPEYATSQIPGAEFVRFSIGLALSDDRTHLREYFEKRSARMTLAQVFEDYATEALDHRNRATHLLGTSQLGTVLARLCRPTDVEHLNRADDCDLKNSRSGPAKLLRAAARDGEPGEIVQVWKWCGSAANGVWKIHRELEKTDDSLAGRLDLEDRKCVDGTRVKLRIDDGRSGVVVRRAWFSHKVYVDFCGSGGRKECINCEELAGVVADEPALDDPAALSECELELQECSKHEWGDFESTVSSTSETYVSFYFEFLAWWERRQRQLFAQRKPQDGDDRADAAGQDSEEEE
eukprot:SAG22_NODE_150_length_17426_cov_8.082588_17_plen_415_part_00